MNNIFSHNPTTMRINCLLSLSGWLYRLSPILINLILGILYFWLLSPSPIAYADLSLDIAFVGEDEKTTHSMAWGDMDGDGDLDLAIGNRGEVNQVYENDGQGNFSLAWESTGDAKETLTVAWGDMDGDGDLDLAFANEAAVNQIYRNEGELNFTLAWESAEQQNSRSIAWGDMDSDGDLDLVVGNRNQVNQIYRNDGNGTFSLSWESIGDIKYTTSVAWGDMDRDGDLDLAVGNLGDVNQIYENDGEGNFQLAWLSTGDRKHTYSIAWGDMDHDGDLDLAIANGSGDVNEVYRNNGADDFTLAWQSTNNTKRSNSVAWGDMDGDGNLDLAFGNSAELDGEVNQIYRNQGEGNFALAWQSTDDTHNTFSVAWGDMDSDGDLDLAVGNTDYTNLIYRNENLANFRAVSDLTGDVKQTQSIAWGDMDADGDLDLAIGNDGASQIYRNEGQGSFSLIWDSTPHLKHTYMLAWGDMDNDGDLDLVLANGGDVNQVYRNDGGSQFNLAWESTGDRKRTRSVAWGDMDGDGDLDLAFGNLDDVNQIYENNGGGHFTLAWESTGDTKKTRSVAWGDMDGDGDLDLAVGNLDDVNQIYQNEDGDHFTLSWASTGDTKDTRSVAWADMDGDGDLDLAFGNYNQVNQVYQNNGDGNFSLGWQPLPNEINNTESIAWGDMDGDGDLDLAVGNADQPNQVYRNEGDMNFTLAWQSPDSASKTYNVAWGDMDSDGDLDLAFGNYTQVNQIFENAHWQKERGLPNNATSLVITGQGNRANANFYASGEILTNVTIPIDYTLFDSEEDPLGQIVAFYSMNGGDNWREAIPTADTQTTNLTTSRNGVSHTFTWDTFASGFFGQSDNVMLRFVAYAQAGTNADSGTYQYINNTPGPFQHTALSTTTFPFRVRGTQVRVYSDTIAVGHELPNALVYRLSADQSIGAQPMGSNQPFVTDHNGYLQGRGQLEINDQLIALLPITSTSSYRLYHTSAVPNLTGLDTYSVTTPGVQELVISADNPLILFDLDLSLEWDARNDQAFLSQLELDLKRTSRFLYDWTNGQLALGKINVYQAKENWLDSHIIIPASNNLRPGADLGGILTAPVSEILSNGQVITDAYLPGQVRMTPIWNRFGNIDDELGLDWPRTLAHELSHYLLFLPDNYLGQENGRLIEVECAGSAMTDPYRDDYSEFLTRDEWSGDCERTLAHHHLGRTDWETITTFYNMLNGENRNPGPGDLPLNVTQVTFVEPETPLNTLPDPFFYVTDEEYIRLELPIGQAQGYVFKTQGTPDVTDDVVVALGSPFAEQIQARGAEPGDRLCVFDYSQTVRRLGCLEAITQGSTNLALHEVPGWQPQITLASVTSRTLAITVTQAIPSADDLYVQVLPAAQPLTTVQTLSPMATMIPIGSDVFTETVTLDYPIAHVFVRVWASGQPLREEMSEFSISGAWGPDTDNPAWGPDTDNPAWGPDTDNPAWGAGAHRYGWGVNRRHGWEAPVSSSDGQVTILDLDNIFGRDPIYTLQSLSTPPNLPPWLTPVGQAYRFSSAEPLTSTLTIMFSYLQREVPSEREDRLWMAYSPDEGESWQLLEPSVDTYHNLASAEMAGEGIYTLISTIEVPLTGPAWNNFSYLAQTSPVTEALGSIEGYYTLVANYEASREQPWIFYDPQVVPEFADLLNDLTHLELEKSYWVNATEDITLYLKSGEVANRTASRAAGLQLPPATFYGWVTATEGFTPTVGMTVTARIDGNVCGQTTVEALDTRLAYKVQVMAENAFAESNGCGQSGREVLFEVGDHVMEGTRRWDNRRTWFHSLPNSTTPPTDTTFTTELVTGWNLLSIPVQPTESAIEHVLRSISGNYSIVYAFDACQPDQNKRWQLYDPSNPPFANSLNEVLPMKGYWINMTAPDTLEVTGAELTNATIALCEEWNLVGHPFRQARALPDVLAPIEGRYTILYGYEAAQTSNPWQKYDPAGPPFANSLSQMAPGRGYWIRITEAGDWPFN